MTLYHISLDTAGARHETCLYVPESGYDGEDSKTPRICLSSSLDGCLTGCTLARICIDWILSLSESIPEQLPKDIFLPWVVEQFSIRKDDSSLWLPEKVFAEGGVIDAIQSKEHWITRPKKPTRTQVLWLTGFKTRTFTIQTGAQKMLGFQVYDSTWSETRATLNEDASKVIEKLTSKCLSQG